LEWVYKQSGVLFGPCWAKWAPKETNPKRLLYLDKHAYFITYKILPKLFSNPKIRQYFENQDYGRL